MPPRNLIFGFIWRFVLGYGLLIFPWPGFNDAYGRYFRVAGQLLFAKENNRRILRFEPVPEASRHGLDTRIALADREQLDRSGTGSVIYLELDTRGVGWVPTALILALIFATPVRWRRRAEALVWGLLAVHGFIFFSVAVYIWNGSSKISLITLNHFWKFLVEGLEETLINQMGASFAVPVLFWILVTVRREDMIRWRKEAE